jgi:hypothetical protein
VIRGGGCNLINMEISTIPTRITAGVRDRGQRGNFPPPPKKKKFWQMLGKIKKFRADLSGNRLI